MSVKIEFFAENAHDAAAEIILFARTFGVNGNDAVEQANEPQSAATRASAPPPVAMDVAGTQPASPAAEPVKKSRGGRRPKKDDQPSPPADAAAGASSDELEIPAYLRQIGVYNADGSLATSVKTAAEGLPLVLSRIALADDPDTLDNLLAFNSAVVEQLPADMRRNLDVATKAKLDELGVDPSVDGGDALEGEDPAEAAITEDTLKSKMRTLIDADKANVQPLAAALQANGATKLQELKVESYPKFNALLDDLIAKAAGAGPKLF